MKLRKEYKIGIVVALALAGLIWGVPFLKGTGIFSNQRKVFAVYNQVNGITPSNSVTINGLSIGQVDKLGFLPDRSGRILVTMLIDGKVFIPKNSTARIVNSDLLGTKTVEIVFSNEKESVSDNDTLKSSVEAGLLEEVNRQIAPIKEKTVSVLNSIDSIMDVLQTVFNDGSKHKLSQNFQSFGNTIKNVEQITGHLNELVGNEKQRMADILASIDAIMKNLKNNGERISKTIQNIELITDSLAKARLANTIKNTNATLSQLSITLDKINSGKGSLGLLVNDDKLYTNLNKSSKDLDSLLIDMKENPHRYVHFSVFGSKSDKPRKKKNQ